MKVNNSILVLARRKKNECVSLLEMVDSMKKVAKTDQELTVEERNLLSVAYKNLIGARRASWRIITNIESKEESKSESSKMAMIKKYRSQVKMLVTSYPVHRRVAFRLRRNSETSAKTSWTYSTRAFCPTLSQGKAKSSIWRWKVIIIDTKPSSRPKKIAKKQRRTLWSPIPKPMTSPRTNSHQRIQFDSV